MSEPREPAVVLPTFKEIDDFLVEHKKKPCPWCDQFNWGLHLKMPEDKSQPHGDEVSLRSLQQITIYQEREELKASLSLGARDAFPTVVVQCNVCGRLDFFGYFAIINLLKARKRAEGTADV